MTDRPILLDLTTPLPEAAHRPRTIRWCDGHWAQLMFALKDRGLEDRIAPDPETLRQKFLDGELDVHWEAFTVINMHGFNIFGPDRIVDRNAGCPVCAFANMIEHVADEVSAKLRGTH